MTYKFRLSDTDSVEIVSNKPGVRSSIGEECYKKNPDEYKLTGYRAVQLCVDGVHSDGISGVYVLHSHYFKSSRRPKNLVFNYGGDQCLQYNGSTFSKTAEEVSKVHDIYVDADRKREEHEEVAAAKPVQTPEKPKEEKKESEDPLIEAFNDDDPNRLLGMMDPSSRALFTQAIGDVQAFKKK